MSENNVINDSIFNFDALEIKEFDSSEFIKKLMLGLQDVLNNRFGVGHPKSKIKATRKSINFSCPYCGDGKSNSHRAHIYYNSYSFKCWNDCNVSFASLSRFIDDFGIVNLFDSSELMYIKTIFEQYMEKRTGFGNNQNILNGGNTNIQINDSSGGYSKIQKKPEIDEYSFPRGEIMKLRKLREVNDSTECINYLLKRKIIKAQIDVYNQKYYNFAYNEYYQDLYIFNLASNGYDIIGIQIRHLSEKSRRRFTSITWGDIWKDIFKMQIENEEELRLKFDKISMMWNALNIDYSKRFYILEGTMDAIFIENSIACWGLSNFVYNKSAYYITDNTTCDIAGKKTAIELLNGEYNTFLWGKFMYDYPLFQGCKDINDIYKKDVNFDSKIFNNYFSNETFDMIWL